VIIDAHKTLAGRRMLVTGGSGTIGDVRSFTRDIRDRGGHGRAGGNQAVRRAG